MRFGVVLWNVSEGLNVPHRASSSRNLGQSKEGFCNCFEMRGIKINQGRSRWLKKKRKGHELLDKPRVRRGAVRAFEISVIQANQSESNQLFDAL